MSRICIGVQLHSGVWVSGEQLTHRQPDTLNIKKKKKHSRYTVRSFRTRKLSILQNIRLTDKGEVCRLCDKWKN